MTSHVTTMPILTEPYQDHAIEKRFQAAKEVYNGALDHYLKQVQLAQDSIEFQRANKKSKVYKDYGVKFHRTKYGNLRRDIVNPSNWILNHLSANQCDSIVKVAGEAVQDWIYGSKGKPKFKTASRKNPLNSITACNQFDLEVEGQEIFLRWGTSRSGNGPLLLRLEADQRNMRSLQDTSEHPEIAIVRRRIGVEEDWRYFCHVTCNGHPPFTADVDVESNRGKRVGVDIGVSTVAAVNEDGEVLHEPFCEEIEEDWREIKRLDRKMDRQRRDSNPSKFDDDGTIKHHSKWDTKDWYWSKAYKKTRSRKREIFREMREHRKRLHEKLANKILELGTDIIVEDNEYKGWQESLFGNQVRSNAPAEFARILEYKAESLKNSSDGNITKCGVDRVSTYDTKLSKRCVCGHGVDKKLSDRIHDCPNCDVRAQRDVFSAFLACHVEVAEDEDKLDVSRAKKAWDESEIGLKESASSENEE